MIHRKVEDTLQKFLRVFPAVVLLGPRQVGKTTLARSLESGFSNHPISEYFDLENPMHRTTVMSEPLSFFYTHEQSFVIMDEIHRTPELFPILRGIIDDRRALGKNHGQFLFLGSASMDLLKQSTESLAGRIGYVELTGFTAAEITQALTTGSITFPTLTNAIEQLWLTGGFPNSFLAPSLETSMLWRQAFIRSYLERDIPLFGLRVPSHTLERFLTLLAHLHGSLVNASKIANGLDLSSPTIKRYLDFFEDLLLIRSLPPWTNNLGKRLIKSPKIYVRDSGLVHALLGINTMRDLLSHPIVGMSYEGFVIENLITALAGSGRISFYRTVAGAEIDLVIERGQDIIAIEIKRTSTPKLTPGFLNGCIDIKATLRYFVYPGDKQFSLGQSTEAIPLTVLMDILSKD